MSSAQTLPLADSDITYNTVKVNVWNLEGRFPTHAVPTCLLFSTVNSLLTEHNTAHLAVSLFRYDLSYSLAVGCSSVLKNTFPVWAASVLKGLMHVTED